MKFKGIDVSKWQGNIDFEKVAKAGYNFVIIRAGYGSYGIDPNFEKNIKKALKAGLKVGAYWFLYAKNNYEVAINAQMCDAVLRSYKDDLSLGIWADWEYDSDKYTKTKFSNHERSLIIKHFCEALKKEDYEVGLYLNPDYIKNKLDMDVLKGYKLWLAWYTDKEDKALAYKPYIWQHSSEGLIPGITGKVDLDYLYEPEAQKEEKPKCYGIVTTKGSNLNVRDGAGTKFKQIGKVPNGKEVEILTKNGNWYKINYKGLIGYVSKTYIKEK